MENKKFKTININSESHKKLKEIQYLYHSDKKLYQVLEMIINSYDK